MANPEHVEIVKQGREVIDTWYETHLDMPLDISHADLSGVYLRDADLHRADLNHTNLRGAYLRGTDFHGAQLNYANLSGADLRDTNFHRADLNYATILRADLRDANLNRTGLHGAQLNYANLIRTNLNGANLHGANLNGANLRGANLRGANLNGASLRGSDLSHTHLNGANLGGANLGMARLIAARLTGATLSGSCLWETQRADWSIKNVICDVVYWDKNRKIPTRYALSEFERYCSETTKIALHYVEDISPVEVASLPALIQKLDNDFPSCSFRLQSIQADAGGATVTIVVENTDAIQLRQIEAHGNWLADVIRQKILPDIKNEIVASNDRILLTISQEIQNQLADLRQLVSNANRVLNEPRPTELNDAQRDALKQIFTTILQHLEAQTPDYSFKWQAITTLRDVMHGVSGGFVTMGLLKLPEILRALELLPGG